MKYNIKNLINEDVLQKNIELNQDPYGKACVQVAINVMEYLDNFKGEFNIGYSPNMTTPHGIMCECDDQGGITGFMAGAARNMVAICHTLGWKFYLADVLSPYDLDKHDRHEEVANIISDAKGVNVSFDEAMEYINGLVERYNRNEQ